MAANRVVRGKEAQKVNNKEEEAKVTDCTCGHCKDGVEHDLLFIHCRRCLEANNPSSVMVVVQLKDGTLEAYCAICGGPVITTRANNTFTVPHLSMLQHREGEVGH